MDQISRIYYPVFLLLKSFYEDFDINEVVPDIRIIFGRVWGSPIHRIGEAVPTYKYRYTCMSCQEAIGEYWYTDEFGQGKTIPANVEDQMRTHAEQHAKLGAWGISIYKRWRNK
jgi:hypothetical protein